MGEIKINDIVYGTDNASSIIYKNTTVEEKLDTIPVFDPSDNTYIEANQYDYLTYGHIINHLDSDASDKVLSAKQGKILNEKFNNIDFSPLEAAIGENAAAIESLGGVSSDNTDKINSIFLALEEMMELIKNSESPIILRITADDKLANQTLIISNSTHELSVNIDSSCKAEIKLPSLGEWNISNPLTNKIQTINVDYYGVHKIHVYCYHIYSVIINHGIADPGDCCTYADDAIGMEKASMNWFNMPIFRDMKNCILVEGQVAAYLDKNNLYQDINGNGVEKIYGEDIMLEIPRIGYKIEWLDGANLKVSITDDPSNNTFNYGAFSYANYNDCDKLYIGTFLGFYKDRTEAKLYSVFNTTPDKLENIATARKYAANRGPGYVLYSFNMHTLIQCLYIIWAGNLNSQATVANGGGDSKANGSTNTFGFMNELIKTTNPSYATGSEYPCKCFGIEALWARNYCLLDGVYTNSKYEVTIARCAINHGDTNNYINYGQVLSSKQSGFISLPHGGNIGFFGKALGGSSTTLYCDKYYCNASCIALVGGTSGNAESGIFRVDNDIADYDAYGRLTYMHREV